MDYSKIHPEFAEDTWIEAIQLLSEALFADPRWTPMEIKGVPYMHFVLKSVHVLFMLFVFVCV